MHNQDHRTTNLMHPTFTPTSQARPLHTPLASSVLLARSPASPTFDFRCRPLPQNQARKMGAGGDGSGGHQPNNDEYIIIGAGPVGLLAALGLVQEQGARKASGCVLKLGRVCASAWARPNQCTRTHASVRPLSQPNPNHSR